MPLSDRLIGCFTHVIKLAAVCIKMSVHTYSLSWLDTPSRIQNFSVRPPRARISSYLPDNCLLRVHPPSPVNMFWLLDYFLCSSHKRASWNMFQVCYVYTCNYLHTCFFFSCSEKGTKRPISSFIRWYIFRRSVISGADAATSPMIIAGVIIVI